MKKNKLTSTPHPTLSPFEAERAHGGWVKSREKFSQKGRRNWTHEKKTIDPANTFSAGKTCAKENPIAESDDDLAACQ